jgi:flavorubredoxin
MVKVLVVYDSKYGNTKRAGESILEGIQESEGFETSIGYVNEIDIGKSVNFDAIVLGAPNHMGRPSRTMKKFVEKLTRLNLTAKYVAVFGTYSGRMRTADRAMKKLEKMVQTKLPNLNLISPSQSVRVNGVSGPLVEGELPKCVDFGRRIANIMKQEK